MSDVMTIRVNAKDYTSGALVESVKRALGAGSKVSEAHNRFGMVVTPTLLSNTKLFSGRRYTRKRWMRLKQFMFSHRAMMIMTLAHVGVPGPQRAIFHAQALIRVAKLGSAFYRRRTRSFRNVYRGPRLMQLNKCGALPKIMLDGKPIFGGPGKPTYEVSP